MDPGTMAQLLATLREVIREGNRVHVIPSGGRWAVLREGNRRASNVMSSKQRAIQRAFALAMRTGGEVIVHTKGGGIESRKLAKQATGTA